ncbi:DUF4870 domain-containing protein [Flavobacterium sp. XS2P39]|uniref:DUF4870 domain-containing protein n=1 Tax=Flavobacterium sp. XS2P39 TaxID=3401725 RepID=UPI003AAD63E6
MKFKTKMNKKKISLISYITILGWIVSFILYSNGGKSPLAKYHLKQSFGLGILGVLPSITPIIIDSTSPTITILFILTELVLFILLTLGIRNAINQQKKPIPVIGSIFIDRFYFI